MADCLYTKHRPKTINDLAGQEDIVKIIRGYGQKIPNAIIAIGGSGTGKTSTLRILSRMVGVDPETNATDYQEINCGDVKSPLDTIQEIRQGMTLTGLQGHNRVYLLDELQAFSRSRFSMEAMLKTIEDGPNHTFFFLGTTDPQKILKTILNRCHKLTFKAIPDGALTDLIKRVAKAENLDLEERLIDKIVDASAGSARTALVELEKIAGLEPKDRMAAVGRAGAEKGGYDLAKELLPFQGQANWAAIASLLEDVKDEDSESIRLIVLGLARSALLKGGNNPRGILASRVIDRFELNMYGNDGRAILANACYKVVFGK